MKILVSGAKGLLGSTLCPHLASCGHEVLTQSRSADAGVVADMANYIGLKRVLDEHRPEVIINLAALADVDACEQNPQAAYSANTLIVENLARWIRVESLKTHLIQISTDQVYDGPGPHMESDACPANTYALSKYAGELAALCIGATVLRVNFFGISQSPGRKSFSDWLVESFQTGARINLFNDVWFSPLSMTSLAQLLERVIELKTPGVFNLGSRGGLSKAGFARALAKAAGLSMANARETSVADAPLRAYRSRDMRMHVQAFESAFAVELPDIGVEIEAVGRVYAGANR